MLATRGRNNCAVLPPNDEGRKRLPYLLACAQSAEVLRRPRYHVIEEFQCDPTHPLALFETALVPRGLRYLDVQEHPRILRVGFTLLFLTAGSDPVTFQRQEKGRGQEGR